MDSMRNTVVTTVNGQSESGGAEGSVAVRNSPNGARPTAVREPSAGAVIARDTGRRT